MEIDLNELIIYEAKVFWEECPQDFCLQYDNSSAGTLIFGGSNRVIWHIKYGFRLDETYCSKKFTDHFNEIMKGE